MTIKTTCIGAYPKPDYVKLPDWFNQPAGPDTADPTALWEKAMEDLGPDAETIISKGVAEAISDQISCGIDIPTDGEIPRENYIHYHCRHLLSDNFPIFQFFIRAEQHKPTTVTREYIHGLNKEIQWPLLLRPIKRGSKNYSHYSSLRRLESGNIIY